MSELENQLLQRIMLNKKRTFGLFKDKNDEQFIAEEESIRKKKVSLKYQRQYDQIGVIPGVVVQESQRNKALKDIGVAPTLKIEEEVSDQIKIGQVEEESKGPAQSQGIKALPAIESGNEDAQVKDKGAKKEQRALSLVSVIEQNQNQIALRQRKQVEVQWHAPWKLKRVISGHTGWVRCIAVDPMNKFFATGSTDRTIKFWDLIDGKLKITLTGHVNTVRGLAISDRHPYLFSCGEDKTVKCWDLEQNKVVRHYHGHLSGVYTLALHPELDLLVTGGRDSTARVWDMRTKAQVHVLGGHANTVEDIICQSDEPQIITASHDKMIRMWDIRTGTTLKTLTQHKKGVRALANHHQEHTFASAGSDKIRIWKQPEGDQLRTISDHNVVVNSLAINEDNVLVSGGDDGSLQFYDWKSGQCFQKLKSPVQPGSLSSEAAIFDIKFDRSSLRMITAECDKSIKIWKEDENATPETHPVVQQYV